MIRDDPSAYRPRRASRRVARAVRGGLLLGRLHRRVGTGRPAPRRRATPHRHPAAAHRRRRQRRHPRGGRRRPPAPHGPAADRARRARSPSPSPATCTSSARVRRAARPHPRTVFGPAAPVLRRADLTMVNLETAITNGGVQQNKEFTFRAPPIGAHRAARRRHRRRHDGQQPRRRLRHARAAGLACARSGAQHFPVIGIGRDAAAGVRPVHDHAQRHQGGDLRRRPGAGRDDAVAVLRRRRTSRASPTPTEHRLVARGAAAHARPATSWSSTCTGASSTRPARPR